MKQKILVCKNCETTLTKPLTILVEGEDRFPKLEWLDEKPLSYRGVCLKRDEPYSYCALPHGPKPALDFAPCYLIRLDDLLDTVGLTSDPHRLNGCCGLDGCDGPNRICECEAFVGTEKSDCWTPMVFIPDNEKTKWQNVKS